MGVPGSCSARPAGHHPALYGSADHRCHRQSQGAQAQGRPAVSLLSNSLPNQMVYHAHFEPHRTTGNTYSAVGNHTDINRKSLTIVCLEVLSLHFKTDG